MATNNRRRTVEFVSAVERNVNNYFTVYSMWRYHTPFTTLLVVLASLTLFVFYNGWENVLPFKLFVNETSCLSSHSDCWNVGSDGPVAMNQLLLDISERVLCFVIVIHPADSKLCNPIYIAILLFSLSVFIIKVLWTICKSYFNQAMPKKSRRGHFTMEETRDILHNTGDMFRSVDKERVKKELNRSLQGFVSSSVPANKDITNETEAAGIIPPVQKEAKPPRSSSSTGSPVGGSEDRSPTVTEYSSQPNGGLAPSSDIAVPTPIVDDSCAVQFHQLFTVSSCIVYLNKTISLNYQLLSHPHATSFLTEQTMKINSVGRMKKYEFYCSSEGELRNLDVTEPPPIMTREHFIENSNRKGYVIFSSDLECFPGTFCFPMPKENAVADKFVHGGNGFAFTIFHGGKEFAVKKMVYQSKEIRFHSQLCHPNIINLEAVLVGEKHERYRDKHYVYCFMQKMDVNFRSVLSTKDYGCLKHLKVQLNEKREQWELVLVNAKHVLRSVLKALEYMHSQGLVHRDVKASNILIKMTCHCTEVLYCNCHQGKFLVQIGDFDSSATVPGYQLQLEEHQMIRYASVLPLGTMGYRAPEVSMHLVLSGPYETLYTTSVDIWSFGCLLLTVFIGKSGPLKQRGEASLLLSAQDHPYSQELYNKIIKIDEVQKHYRNTHGVCDLVQKCLQVQPHCRPTAKELLELDFFKF